MRPSPTVRPRRALALAGALLLAAASASAQPDRYAQHNLVSNIPGLAATTDPQLVNPWGISFGPTSPFWISDNRTDVTTLYNGAGVKQGLVVTIPGGPTGQVFNGTGAFGLAVGGNARFIFATESGKIAAWAPAAGTASLVVVDNSGSGAAYTGLAIAGSGATARLYAANFAAGRVDVFDGSFAPVLGGAFLDPALPAGYSPFNVQTIGGEIYVTYALVDPITHEETAGPGLGFVNVFDQSGTLVRRAVSQGALNAPWGVTLAPASFGGFGGSLLVGNFGDGTINAFDPITGALRGTLLNALGAPLVNEGLWAITFGNGGPGFDANTLYLTAGINDENDGLFASVSPVPEPSTVGLLATGLGALLVGARRRRRA